eukprot:13959320-Heterocapsa_arctica.AAC.1
MPVSSGAPSAKLLRRGVGEEPRRLPRQSRAVLIYGREAILALVCHRGDNAWDDHEPPDALALP